MKTIGELLSVRTASVQDSEGILNCLHSAFGPYQSLYTSAAYEDTVLTPQTLQNRLKTMSVLVADSGGIVVGTISCGSSGEEGHLRGMAVQPAWLGKNVAHRLLEAAEQLLRDKGCSRVTLDTTLPLERAMRFYEKHGYLKSGRVSDFYGMPLHEYEKIL
jgi:GNAT superfamily N-acetyltransferase